MSSNDHLFLRVMSIVETHFGALHSSLVMKSCASREMSSNRSSGKSRFTWNNKQAQWAQQCTRATTTFLTSTFPCINWRREAQIVAGEGPGSGDRGRGSHQRRLRWHGHHSAIPARPENSLRNWCKNFCGHVLLSDLHGCTAKGPVHTGPATGACKLLTILWLWECSHSLQATSKGLHANVLTRPVWMGP